MAGKREEVDVGLDVDGKAIGKMFADLDKRLAHIKKSVGDIGKLAENAGKRFDAGLISALSRLNKVEGVVSKFERNVTTNQRRPVTNQLDELGWGKRVRQVSEYGKTLKDARNHAEMLEIRIAKLHQTAARSGEMTTHQRRRLRQLEDELSVVMRLDKQYGNLLDKARQTGGGFKSNMSAVDKARGNLTAALAVPGRTNFQAELNALKDSLASFSNSIRGQVAMNNQRGPNLFGATGMRGIFARTAAYGGAASLMYGGLSTAQSSLQFAADFEAQLKQLQAIAGATDTQMLKLKESILEVGRGSKFSLLEITKMAQTLAQAGVSTRQMSDVLRSVNNLAVASGSTPDESVQLVTSALGSFQLQSSEAARVADMMTEALNRTKLTVQQTALAIQYVGATAFEQNIPLEKMLATVGAVAQAGVRSGSTIGTGFRQMLVELENPSEKLITVLDKFKLTAKDVDVQTRGIDAVLRTMKEAGIGAGQAYEALDLRAAAFYLTAKNNVDIISELQIAMANQASAAKANEVAMNSLTAQWQRYKNNIGERFSEMVEFPMTVLKNLLKEVNDAAEEGADKALPGWKQRLYEIDGVLSDGLLDGLEYMANWAGPKGTNASEGGLGTWVRNLGAGAAGADALATAVKETSEAVEEKRGKVDGLTKELQRLYTQESSIRDIQSSVNAETASLSTRFEGLAKYLIHTKGKFDDLVRAMRDLRAEEQGLLVNGYLDQRAALAGERVGAMRKAKGMQDTFKRQLDAGYLKELPADVQRAATMGTKAFRDPNMAARVLYDYANSIRESNAALAGRLDELAGVLNKIITNTVLERRAASNANFEHWRSTGKGRGWESSLDLVQGKISEMGPMDQDERRKSGGRLIGQLANLDVQVDAMLKKHADNAGLVEYLTDIKKRADEARRAVNAAMTANKRETKEEAKAKREAAAAERERKRLERFITRSDLDSFGGLFGLPLGSGFRSQAQQDAIKSKGKARVSQHTVGIARDFPTGNMSVEDMNRLSARMQAEADRRYGKDAIRFQAEHGPGRGNQQGTAPHIHGQVAKDATIKRNAHPDAPKSDLDLLAEVIKNDKAALAVLADEIDEKIKDLKYAVSDAVFDNTVKNVEESIDNWAEQLRNNAENEIAHDNMSASEAARKRQEVEKQIKQKQDELLSTIFDNFLKNLDKQFAEIERATEQQMAFFEGNVSKAEARIAGYGYASNEGKVPEFVSYLAERKASRAREQRDRAYSTTLVTEIGLKERAVSAAASDPILTKIGADPAKLQAATEKLAQLRLELERLKISKEALDAGLNAGQDIPTSIGQGLEKAAQAYIEMHKLGQSFTEFVNGEMMGVLGAAHQGMTTFFTDIITGARSVKQAFGDFVKSMLQYLAQLVAKFIAAKIFKIILTAVGGGGGGGGMMHGGYVKGARHGEYIRDGVPGRDSTVRRLAQGEFVMRKAAVDSLGVGFVRDMNERGRGAVRPSAIPMAAPALQETNVYIVKENERPQLGPKDILVVVQDDILKNGQTKKLIRHVAQGG